MPRIGAVPRRGTALAGESGRGPGERETRSRKPGDEATDWRKNADPGRERPDRGEGRTGRERDPSRSRGGDDTGERKKRDRSRGDATDENRRWREDSTAPNARDKERKGRDPSSTREEVNGRSKKRSELEEDKRRKEDRESKPAWLDDDPTITNGGPKGFMSLSKAGDGELDELQKWKLEKKAKEEQREREEREATNRASDATVSSSTAGEAIYSSSTAVANSNAEEHKTPRASNVHYELPPNSSLPPLPSIDNQEPSATTNSSSDMAPGNALVQLRALMLKSHGDQPPASSGSNPNINGAPPSGFGTIATVESPSLPNQTTSFSNVISRPAQTSSPSVKYDSDENRRPNCKYSIRIISKILND